MSNSNYINTLIKIIELPQLNKLNHIFNGDCVITQPTKLDVSKRPCDGISCGECIFAKERDSSELGLKVLNNVR